MADSSCMVLSDALCEDREGSLSGDALRAGVMPTEAEVARARRWLHQKAMLIAFTVLVSYALVLAGDVPWVGRLLAFPVLIVALIMVATSVMHDANHGAFFAGSTRANHIVGYASDLLGVSSALWRLKHDIHHADANVQGIDPDIDQGAIARLAPMQRRRFWHRWQHRYLWPLYGLLGVQWLLVSDFGELVGRYRRAKADPTLPRLSNAMRAGIFTGKALHFGWAIALPLVWYPWWAVAIGYLSASWCVGVVLAVTFQVAHCVEEADFVLPDAARRNDAFVWHQLRTTVDVAPNRSVFGRLRSLIVGGLDYQIEHHLAPHIPHTSYAAMAKRLHVACAANGVRYRTHASVSSAIRSHHRWLRTLST